MGGGDEDAVAGTESSGGGEVTIHIRCSNSSKFSVQASLGSTVASLKSVIAQKCDISADQQRLIYKGRILKDDQTLESYGLEADHTIHMVRGFPAAASGNNTGGTNAGPPINTVDPRTTPLTEGGPFGGLGLGGSLLPGLGSNGLGSGSGLFGAGLTEIEQVQQQLTENPNMMRDIMNMPLVQNLMNNPDVIRNMIMNNPQMRELIDRNPELAHVLNDPSTLRQTLEAARNPELMREMMRNTDRAMSNIESSPEGFNMLRRMYENVQEPLLHATTESRDTTSDVGSNPFAALLGLQGGGQGRNQSANPTTTGSQVTSNAPAPNTNPLPNPWASAGAGGAQPNTTRSNSIFDVIQPRLAGSIRPSPADILGATPETNSMNQLLQNPDISQMMQSFLSNPQYMNQILGLNPQLRSMFDSNPQLREMMQNPDFIRQMTSPETMQQLLTFQRAMSQLGGLQSTQEPGQNLGTTGTDNFGMDALMNMFGALGAGSLAPNRSNVPPEELYATQLAQLQEMGFFDTAENIRALTATAGNVNAAVERLLGNPGH